jgi:SET family sugar efflux transporter-like MFS transporter
LLGVHNASGLVASMLVVAYADQHGDYLQPMLGCAVLTLALALLLGLATSLPWPSWPSWWSAGPQGSALTARRPGATARCAPTASTARSVERTVPDLHCATGDPALQFLLTHSPISPGDLCRTSATAGGVAEENDK